MTTTTDGRPIEFAVEPDRFVARVGGKVAGLSAYREKGDVVTFIHTETDPAVEGQGVASALVRFALDHVRQEGKKVRPACPFVRTFIRRHQEEYGPLMVSGFA